MKIDTDDWEIELDHMVAQLRYALENLDSIENRKEVRHKIEDTYNRIREMADLCKGEMK